jgi:nicotinic acid mononucleotide adenylyltransferase
LKKIGLYFGSFNPIHVGHLIIADYFSQQNLFDEVWLVVSPHNQIDFRIWQNANITVLDLSVGSNNLGWPKFL